MSEELNAAQARIACLEGEIAKRDEELAACRVAVENCEVFRARIAELEARIVWLECEAQVNSAPVSEAKAQGVVMPDVNAAAKALCNRHAMICGVDADDQWKEYSQDFIADAETVLANARLNAAPVQQVSAPDERIIPTSAELIQWAWEEEPEETRFQEGYNAAKRWVKMQIEAGIAAPAAPAADAGLVLEQAMYALIGIGYHENSGLVHELRQSLAAHRAKGVV